MNETDLPNIIGMKPYEDSEYIKKKKERDKHKKKLKGGK